MPDMPPTAEYPPKAWLSDFLTLQQIGTTAEAAHALGYRNNKTLLRHVEQIEQYFGGVELFHRPSTGASDKALRVWRLTEHGRRLDDIVRAFYDDISRFRLEMMRHTPDSRAQILLCSNASIASDVLPLWLAHYEKLSPIPKIRLRVANTFDLALDLKADLVDAAFTYGAPDVDNNLPRSSFEHLVIGSDHVVPMCASENEAQRVIDMLAKGQGELQVVTYSRGIFLRDLVGTMLRDAGIRRASSRDETGLVWRMKAEADSTSAIVALTAALGGVTFLPRFALSSAPHLIPLADFAARHRRQADAIEPRLAKLRRPLEIRLYRRLGTHAHEAQAFWTNARRIPSNVLAADLDRGQP